MAILYDASLDPQFFEEYVIYAGIRWPDQGAHKESQGIIQVLGTNIWI